MAAEENKASSSKGVKLDPRLFAFEFSRSRGLLAAVLADVYESESNCLKSGTADVVR